MTKNLGVIFLLAAVGLFAYLGYQTWQTSEEVIWKNASAEKRMSLMIEKDLANLNDKKNLPPEWNEITSVSFRTSSPRMQSLLEKVKPRIRVSESENAKSSNSASAKSSSVGNKIKNEYLAEVEALEIPDGENPGFIFQISLFDLKSKNKIFELGRSYYFADLEKDSPPKNSVLNFDESPTKNKENLTTPE